MSVDVLLSRLDAVKQTGSGRWLARCSGHEDRSPSLAIRETQDGTVLVHCFAGCDTEAVLSAVGLTFSDLYPPRLDDHPRRRERRLFPASDILKAIAHEALVVALAAEDLHRGELSDEDHDRLLVAAQRIRQGVELSEGANHGN